MNNLKSKTSSFLMHQFTIELIELNSYYLIKAREPIYTFIARILFKMMSVEFEREMSKQKSSNSIQI